MSNRIDKEVKRFLKHVAEISTTEENVGKGTGWEDEDEYFDDPRNGSAAATT